MSPEEREEALEAALEALAHGRDDLVPDELRAELEATGATGAVEQAKAASLDLSLLFDAAQPEVDVSALVSAALAAAPRRVPADVAPSARVLWFSGLLALVGTISLLALRVASLPSMVEILALGRGLGALFHAVDHWVGTNVPFGWAGLGAGSAAFSVLLAWPLARISSSTPSGAGRHALGAASLLLALLALGMSGEARALDFEGTWPEGEAGVRVDVDGVPASVALRAAAESVGLGLVARLPDDPEVTVHVRDASLQTVVRAILGDAELGVRREGNLLVVAPASHPASQSAPVPDAPSTPSVPDAPAAPDVPAAPTSGHDLGERVSFGSDVHVAAGEVVRSVATFGGDAVIDGEVLRDVATMGGDVEISPTGRVRGDIVSMGGDIQIARGGVVEGSVVPMGGDVESHGASPGGRVRMSFDDREREREAGHGWFSDALSSAASFGLLFLLGVLLMGVARGRLRGVQRAIVQAPVRCGVIGLLSAVATVFILVALTVTVVGFPAAVVLAVLVPAAVYVGVAATASVLGAALPVPAVRGRPVLGLAAGVALIYVTSLVPVVGTLLLISVAAVGFGAVVHTRFGKQEVAN